MDSTKLCASVVTYACDGFADEKFVEVDGAKFVADDSDPTKPKLDDKGNKVPFKAGDDKAKDNKSDANDQHSLEERAKTDPVLAQLLEQNKKLQQDAEQRKADEEKRKEENMKKQGQWQSLAESRAQELDKVKEENAKKDLLIGKQKASIKKVLDDVIKTIPKENLGLIPENFSEREKLEYITQNAKVLGAKIVGAGSGVPKSDETPATTDEDKVQAEITELQKKQVKTQADHTKIWELAKKLKEIRGAKAQADKK